MGFRLNFEERIVLKYLQEEEEAATSIDVANRTGLDHHQVKEVFASLAEKDLFIAEDRTAGELSQSGRDYNVFDDECIDTFHDRLPHETKKLLDHFIEDPDANPSREVLAAAEGLKPEEIERAIEELEHLGYPARRRVQP
jgi:DNA-binding transcriptional regulator YhcF (GntR family)